MEPMTLTPVHADGWTVDDLPDLPDDGMRYEILDGSLLVTPPAIVRHYGIAFELGVLLKAALDDSWRITPGAGVALDRRNYREPDLTVVRREALEGAYAKAQDVLLVVEVMSPSSVTDDRLVKPAQYARAGIPHYWRVEAAAPVLITYELAGEVYRETGRFTGDVVLDDPVPLRFRLATLLA